MMSEIFSLSRIQGSKLDSHHTQTHTTHFSFKHFHLSPNSFAQ